MKQSPCLPYRSLLLLITLLISELSFSQFNLDDPLPADANVKIGKLPNGLTYYIRKNEKPENKAELRLAVNVGSILEENSQQGLAHFMEHMNFNGSTHFPKNELVSYLQSIGVQFGADLNAYTGFDETVYILPIPTEDTAKVEKGFTILEDWAANSLLDTSEIQKERGVVLEESRLGKGANERMRNKYFPKLLNGSKYAERLPIGIDDTLKNFKPETLASFYKTWYRPDLMAVIVVGDIDPAIAEQEIIKHFNSLQNPAAESERPAFTPIANRTVSEAMVLTDKEATNKILEVINYIEKEKPLKTWGDYRQSIVEDLFSSIIGQRLSELTQQANPPFAYASAGFSPFLRGHRAFTSFAVLGDKPVKDAVDSLLATTESVKKFGFLQTELERAKSDLLNETERAFRDKDKTESYNFVEAYISNFLDASPIPGIANRYAFIQQILPGITLQEVNALAAKMETGQGKFVLLTAPQSDSVKLPSNQQLLNFVTAAQQLSVKPYKEKSIATSLLEKIPSPGKITEETANAALGTINLTLGNGITITLKPTDFKNDEIQMDAWRWGGTHNFNIADKENAENAAQIIQAMGVKDLSPTDLRKFLAGKTVSAQPYLNPDDEGIQGNSSVKDFETLLQLVHLYFTQPKKEETLFQSYITTQKSFTQNIKANPFNYFSDTVTKIEFKNNPWAGGIPDAGDYDKIKLDRAFSIYKKLYGNAYGMHFTFAGNIDTSKVIPLLATYLGSLPATPEENKFTDVGMRPVTGVVEKTIIKGSEPKSLVNIIFTGEAEYSQDEALRLRVLTDVLNIKIIEQLREEMSGIYGGGMNGALIKRPYNHYSINISFPCGPQNVDTLSAALFTIIRTAKEKGIEQKDLDKVKETLKEHHKDALKQNEYWLDRLTNTWIEKEDPEWMLTYVQKVDALTTQDIQTAAKKYFNMQNYIKAVLLPEK